MYSYYGANSVHMFSDKPPFIPDTSNREFPADFLKPGVSAAQSKQANQQQVAHGVVGHDSDQVV